MLLAGLNAPEQEISWLVGTPAHAAFLVARQVQPLHKCCISEPTSLTVSRHTGWMKT